MNIHSKCTDEFCFDYLPGGQLHDRCSPYSKHYLTARAECAASCGMMCAVPEKKKTESAPIPIPAEVPNSDATKNNYQLKRDWSAYSRCHGMMCWADGGNDAFDGWGNFKIGAQQAALPVQGGAAADFAAAAWEDAPSGQQLVKSGWLNRNLFKVHVKCKASGCEKFSVSFGGNYGSDSNSKHGVQTARGVAVHWNGDGASADLSGSDPTVLWAVIDNEKGANGEDPVQQDSYAKRSQGNDGEAVITKPARDISVYVSWGYTAGSGYANNLAKIVSGKWTKEAKESKKAGGQKKCDLVASDTCPVKNLLKPNRKTVEKMANMKLPSIEEAQKANKEKTEAEGKSMSADLGLWEDEGTFAWSFQDSFGDMHE